MSISKLSDIEIFNILKKSDKKTLIYGNGGLAYTYCKMLLKKKIDVFACIVDDEYYIENQYIYKDIAVLRKLSFDDKLENYNIVIGFCNVDRTKELLQDESHNYFLFWKLEELYDYEEFVKHKDELNVIRGRLEDSISKQVLDALILCNETLCAHHIIPLATGDQYFNNLITGGGSFIDCGAFNGDTIRKFVDFSGGVYDEIFAFEPEECNMSELKTNTGQFYNINYIKKGVWNCDDTLTFRGSLGGGHHQLLKGNQMKET